LKANGPTRAGSSKKKQTYQNINRLVKKEEDWSKKKQTCRKKQTGQKKAHWSKKEADW
jgi:hypothetical protein